MTPSQYAVDAGEKTSAELLLEYGADVNGRDFNGQSPLHYAASKGNIEMIDFLIAHGAEINLADKHGFTPAAQALMSLPSEAFYYEMEDGEKKRKAFDWLRQHGAMMGKDVLLAAVSKSERTITLLSELLNGNSYNSSALNEALLYASASCCYKTENSVKLLLQYGAFPETHLEGYKY
ncbi:MAG: ankyrin repeat domain-containing protein, partial [Victivallales bacterium]|nr:ankyrin repeat domain-containing protein [Victivallales bacterium]